MRLKVLNPNFAFFSWKLACQCPPLDWSSNKMPWKIVIRSRTTIPWKTKKEKKSWKKKKKISECPSKYWKCLSTFLYLKLDQYKYWLGKLTHLMPALVKVRSLQVSIENSTKRPFDEYFSIWLYFHLQIDLRWNILFVKSWQLRQNWRRAWRIGWLRKSCNWQSSWYPRKQSEMCKWPQLGSLSKFVLP